ncbi:hypothetical protein [Paraburkholderia bryophila]|uniref:Uncharacterized protein n=1 Tax=Paraburkholderia bryophila TaxID=420952 RepID=A0A329BKE0_9BURK|nr:hypothetical protein [Paraburkholderia bryophila]RAS22347.1 hypothetical protein BX591_12457 [Paraburkholderia bryophila]
MYHDTDLPNLPVSPLDEPAPAGKAYGRPAPAVAPPRFGRLAMGVATAGALALGVLGTVAYGVWFNHDQQAYAEAIAGARQALGASAPVAGGSAAGTLTANAGRANSATQNAANAAAAAPSAPNPTTVVPTAGGTSSEAQAEQGGRLASWSGEVARPATSDPQLAGATDVAPGASPLSSSSAAGRRATVATAPPTLQLAAARPAKDPRSADARAASPSERHAANTRPKSLFARMGQFFHRVSYRQHGNASQQDIYSHP